MADETVYRLIQGDGVQLVEDAGTATVTISVPGLTGKVNVGDIVQATEGLLGIIRLATVAEVRAGNDADKAVTPAGLAAASQASVTDATAGRLMRVGAFGLGGGVISVSSPNLNDNRPNGFYYCNSATNLPAGANNGWLNHVQHADNSRAYQVYANHNGDRVWFRVKAGGAWQPWYSHWHSGNFDPNTKANTSGTYNGLTVGNAGTVGGQTWQSLTPPGMVAYFAMHNNPAGWLRANGAAVSRTTYSALFSAIGTLYGAGNGSTSFNLPDLRGEFIRSWDAGRGYDPGRSFGTSQGSANLSHTHPAASAVNPGHAHQSGTRGVDHIYGGGSVISNVGWGSGPDPTYRGANTSVAGAHDHAITVFPDGSHESRPVNTALLACIKY